MYSENELPVDSPMTGIPVEMPVDVLLAYPNYAGGGAAPPRFNLVGALAEMLGRFGWETAREIIRPHIWAPAWSQEEISRLVASPFRGSAHAFADVDAAELRTETFLGSETGRLRPGYVQYEIVHVFGRIAAPFSLDLGESGVLDAAALHHLLAMARCRLLILHVDAADVPLASTLAADLVRRGVPAVLVASAHDDEAVDEYYLELYAGIIHNTWLAEAARPKGPVDQYVDAEFVCRRGGQSVLMLHEWLEALRARYRSAQQDMQIRFHRLSELRSRAATTMHESQRMAMKPRMEDVADRTEKLAGMLDRTAATFEQSLDFAHESGGAEPLSRIAGVMSEIDEQAQALEEMYPELEKELEEEARHAPRVLNAGFADPEAGRILEETDGLLAGRSYDLLVDVGAAWDKIKSIVHGRAAFPIESLPPDKSGYRVEVVLIAEAFSPRMASAEMWVPRLSGRSFPMKNGEKAAKPGPVALRLTMPSLEEDEHREVRGRLCLYYENNLLQSAVVVAQVVRSEDIRPKAPNEVRVDYQLTGTLRDVETQYDHRRLTMAAEDEREDHRVVMNLVQNGDGAGAHRILVKDRAGVPPARTAYDPVGSRNVLQHARQALLDCFWERDASGKPIAGRNGLDEQNGKPRSGFLHDIYYLSRVGHQLYGMVFQQVDVEGTGRTAKDWDTAMQQVLERSGVIQVARTASTPGQFVFPWALLYDYPLPGPKSAFTWCKVLTEEWTKDGRRSLPIAEGCPHHAEPWHRENVLCPYGFWGLKHVVEQPISVLERLSDAPREIRVNGNAVVSIGKTSDGRLDLAALDAHLKEVLSLDGVALASPPPNPADERESIRALLESSAIVYLLCHGEYDDRQNEPYLGVGLRDTLDAHRIYPSTVISWARTGLHDWPRRHPLVLINGCHTSNLQPGEILNFISAFGSAGAGGAVGTEISVRLPVAVEVARLLFSRITRRVPMGQAMREVRWELANKGSLLGLAYTAYGLADLRLAATS